MISGRAMGRFARARFARALAGAGVLAIASCTSGASPAPPDAGVDAGFGVSTRDAAGDGASDGRVDRLIFHGGATLKRMHLRIVYVGQEGVDAAPDVDGFTTWLLSSSWWRLLREYAIEEGSLDPSVRVPFAAMFPPGTVVDGLLSATEFDKRVSALLHPPSPDAGSPDPDAGSPDTGVPDAGAPDAASAPDAAVSLVPPSDGYLFMLPNGVNVSLGVQGSRTFQTCIDTGGYHAHDGLEPFAVIPPCRVGRSAQTLSHEIAELATNPSVVDGWFSDDEADRKLGVEIADVCNSPVARGVDGWLVTQLWSNVEGRCVPQ
jgi:hypothetical protein